MKYRINILYEFVFVGMLALTMSFFNVPIHTAGEQEEEKEMSVDATSQDFPVEVIPQAPPATQAQTAVEEKRAAERQERRAARQAERERREQEEGEVKEEGEEKEGAEQGIDTNIHTLLMFLDKYEIIVGHLLSAVTFDAIDAMNQEVSPILISGSLLAHIFNSKGNHTENTRMVLEAFYKNFDATRWAVYGSKKQEGDVLSHDFLLIPLRTQGLQVQGQLIQTMVEDFNVEELEKIETTEKNALEIYFNTPKDIAGRHMTLYDHARDLAVELVAQELAVDGKFPVEYSGGFLSFLKYLLLPKDRKSDMDYTGRLTDEAARWVFYLKGHGEYKKSIACLSIKSIGKNDSEFQQLLDFFDKKIKVKLFVYNSCYAAGYNAKEVYGELTGLAGTRVYPFGIVTGATTDAPVQSIINVLQGGIFTFDTSYGEFFENVSREPVNYPFALSFLFPDIKKATSDPTFDPRLIGNIPLIRPPYAPAWFPVVDVDKAVVRIGKITAENRKKDLIIKQYIDAFGKAQDPKAILLATNDVPFPVIIDAGIIIKPPFISLLPGEQEHTLQSVKYEGMEFNDFSGDIIVGKPEYAAAKTFIIRNMEIVNKEGESTIFNDVNIKVQEKIISAIGYDENGAVYDFAIGVVGKDLLAAVFNGDVAAVAQLLSNGAPVNYRDKQGLTILSNLRKIRNRQNAHNIARMLIAYGADVNALSKVGDSQMLWTPLQFACTHDDPIFLKLLLESNKLADINAQDERGDTALHLVMMTSKNKAMVKLLLQYNANPDFKNKKGQSPRDIDPKLMQEVEQELAQEKHEAGAKRWLKKSKKQRQRKLRKERSKKAKWQLHKRLKQES